MPPSRDYSTRQRERERLSFPDAIADQNKRFEHWVTHIVNTTRNSALPLNIRA